MSFPFGEPLGRRSVGVEEGRKGTVADEEIFRSSTRASALDGIRSGEGRGSRTDPAEGPGRCEMVVKWL